MKTVEAVKLSDVFGLIPKPKYVLGTTYTLSLAFFESVVYQHIEESDLRHCLIISDAEGYRRALSEAPGLRGAGQNYLVVAAPVGWTFHAKVWLLADEESVVLLVGSGNLTQSGFMDNAEAFDVLKYSRDAPPSPELHADVQAFLSGLIDMQTRPNQPSRPFCVEVLQTIRKQLQAFMTVPAPVNGPRFLHTFQGPLVSQLPYEPAASRLYVAAPYFGGTTIGLSSLIERYPTAAPFVFPAIHSGLTLDVAPEQIARKCPQVTVAVLDLSPRKKDFAHLKLYGVESADGNAWVFCTSANCTKAAWCGGNVEAGILRFVPKTVLRGYFTADKKQDLPEGLRCQDDNQSSGSTCIQLAAVDYGSHLGLYTTIDDEMRLEDVTLNAISGSKTISIELPVLFANGPLERLSWSIFKHWKPQRGMAVVINLQARRCSGKQVSGGCFLENPDALFTEPGHRRAFRGFLAMLGVEGAPDYADIGALFSLVNGLFDRRLGLHPVGTQLPPSGEATHASEESLDSLKLPLWPPQEVSTLHGHISHSQMGHLRWCQRILEVFLRPQEVESHVLEHAPEIGPEYSEGSENGSEEEQQDRVQEEKRQYSSAAKLWGLAKHDYDRLADRLVSFEPTAETAPDVWPLSIFMFMVTVVVHRAVRRMAPALQEFPSVQEFSEGFLRLMLNERLQDEDRHRAKDSRYRSDERFPPLADDLNGTFHVDVHHDQAIVMLVLVVIMKIRLAPNNEFPGLWRRYLAQICRHGLQWDTDTEDKCCLLWRQYFRDADSAVTDIQYLDCLRSLWAFKETAR